MTTHRSSPFRCKGLPLHGGVVNPWIIGILCVLALLAGKILLGGSSDAVGPNADHEHLHVVRPTTLIIADSYTINRRLSGTVNASQRTDLGFEEGGKVATIGVNEGDHVNAGSVLAKLDTKLLALEERQLKARGNEIDAQLALVSNNLKRQTSLNLKGYASEQQLDELTTERATLNANRQQLDAQLDALQSRINKSRIIAPFTGTITHRFADEGVVLGAGIALLRIQQQGEMEAHIGVPTSLLSDFTPGAQQQVTINNIVYTATVMSISTRMNTLTQTVPVRLALPDNTTAVQNDLVTLGLQESIPETGFWIPVTAVTDGIRGLWTVYILTTSTNNRYQIEARDVQISHSTDRKLFVTGSLKGGEKIVSSGLHRLVPGQIVRLEKPQGNSGSSL